MSATHSQPENLKQIEIFLANARAKAAKAKQSLVLDAEIAYQLAYDAILKGSLTLMLSRGQRPKVQLGHHHLIIEFAAQYLPSADPRIFTYFDHMRRRRNRVLYDIGSVTDLEAEEAVSIVEDFIGHVSSDIAARKKSRKIK